MRFVENIYPFLQTAHKEKDRIAIATLVNVDGSSPRPLGSQIGVRADGRYAGMITGGCAETAIGAEAVRCIDAGVNTCVRYGAGSPYLDVKLPCGSGIDIYIEAKKANAIADDIANTLSLRQPAFYSIDTVNATSAVLSETEANRAAEHFLKILEPDFRLLCFGEGANLISLCLAASAAGLVTEAYSPDARAIQYLRNLGLESAAIHHSYDYATLSIDQYCGVVTVFHEHEWETGILKAALNSNAQYIGALGSRKTHQERLKTLGGATSLQQSPSVIHAPVGLDIGAQSPTEISIAIVAEIIARRRQRAT